MPRLRPYANWNRRQLFRHLREQAIIYGFDIKTVRTTCFDRRWNPIEDYDGCTLVQDPIHPFWPCFKHDFDRIVNGGGFKYEKDFRENLIKAGMKKGKAWRWFIGVTLQWYLYAKWKK